MAPSLMLASLRPEKRAWSLMPTPEQLAQIDLTNKGSVAGTLWAVDIAVVVIVALVVCLRIGVRGFFVKRLFLDDVLAILAAVFTLGLTATTLVATNYGLGQHVWNLDTATLVEQVKRCVQLMFVAQILYACAIALTKLSILASYMRIFPDPRLRTIIVYAAVFTVAFAIASVCVTVFQCSPVNAAWDFDIEDSSCYTYVDFLYASAAIHVLTDIIICVMPLPYFWNLQLPRKQKIIVCGLFVVGGFACVASIIRISYLHMLTGIDVTYNLVNSLIWAIVECSIGIVCVSLPPIRPLVVRLLPSYFKSAASRYGGLSAAAGAQNSVLGGGGGGSRRPSAALGTNGDGRGYALDLLDGDDDEDESTPRAGRARRTSASPGADSSDSDRDMEKAHGVGVAVADVGADAGQRMARHHPLGQRHDDHHSEKESRGPAATVEDQGRHRRSPQGSGETLDVARSRDDSMVGFASR